MKRFLSFVIVLAIMLSLFAMPATTAAAAAVNTNYTFRFSAVFGNYMVLQQNQEVAIWGYGEPHASVVVRLHDSTNAVLEEEWTVSDSNGKWEVTFDAREGSFDAYTITAQSGTQTLTLAQIVFGEVWVLGGQSNMEMYLMYTNDATTVQNQPRNPYIRGYFFAANNISRYEEVLEPYGLWYTAETWDVTQVFSAVGYYFAEKIFDELNVPVGVIHTAIGGSRLTTWIGGETLANDAHYKQLLANAGITANDTDTDSLSGFYNSKIAPFTGLHVKGMLWYQGEAEVLYGTQDTILRYGIPLLNRCWSKVFECDEELLPMITIQLARYDGYTGDNLPKGNEAIALGVEQINMELGGNAITIPLYDVKETSTVAGQDIHPQNKKPVGRRAADAALGMVYNKEGIYSGPIPLSAKISGTNTIEVTFGNVGTGLSTINSAALKGFTIAYGNSSVVTPQMSITSKNKVTLTYSNLANIGVKEVRYAFAVDNISSNLINASGFPAVAFRLSLTNAPVTSVSHNGGVYNEPVSITLSTDSAATTYYTIDGSIPTTSSSVYSGPITLRSSATLCYFSVNSNGTESVRLTRYVVNVADSVAPTTTASVKSGAYYSAISVELTADEDAVIYYTTDGSTPTTSSAVYNGEIVIDCDTTLKFFAVDSYGNVEDIKTENYIVFSQGVQGYGVDVQLGGRAARLYVSGKYNQNYAIPLVVMLHGDGQNATQFEKITAMNDVADDKGFITLYLNADNSNPLSSWKWYDAQSDADYIAQAIAQVKSQYNIDSDKVYIVGFGAGAVMANEFAVRYADVVRGVAVASGAPYGVADNLNSAFDVMANGTDAESSKIINDISTKKVIPVVVIHGKEDLVFSPQNASATVSQWLGANDAFDNGKTDGTIYNVADSIVSADGCKKYVYANTNGYTVAERYEIASMGYAWSAENYVGAYSCKGVNQSELIYDFFERTSAFDYYESMPERDLTAAVTTPSAAGGTYEESVSVILSANETATIYYTTDGTEPTIYSSVFTTPLTFTADTVLKYFSVDSSGNVEQVKTENYKIIERTERTYTYNYDSANSGYVTSLPSIFGAGATLQAGLGGYYQGDSIRAIVSFDTSAFSDNNITSVVLRLNVSACAAAVTGVGIDIRKGSFGNLGLENSDFSASATASAIASKSSVSSGYIDFELPSTYYSYIGSRLEFRVFTTVTNGLSLATINFSQAQLIVKTNKQPAQTYSLRNTYANDSAIIFDDLRLKNALINRGVDANGDGEISRDEILSLYALDVSGESVSTLNGLEYAINLRYLDLSDNSLTDISALSSLDNLQYLNISGNSVSDILPLSQSGLLILSAGNNNISSAVILPDCTNLYLDSNKLTDISALSASDKLAFVSFADNEVASLDAFRGLDYLLYVNADRNKLDLTDGGEDDTVVSSLTAKGAQVSVLEQKSDEPQFVGIESVTSVVENGKVIFTVTASPHFNRIKVTTADALKSYITYQNSCTVNADGMCVYTLKVPAIEGVTNYAFDGRLSDSGIYAADYFYYEVTIEKPEETFKSVSYELNGDKIIFTVVTKADNYGRIKVTTADKLSGSLGVADKYTINADGDYVWTIKANAPTEKTSYAFDLRNSLTGKYLKEYHILDVDEIYVANPIKSVTMQTSGDKLVFTVVTNAGTYGRIKVTTADNPGGSLAVSDKYTVNADGDYVWTVKVNVPDDDTVYAFDLRDSSTGKYMKKYHTVSVSADSLQTSVVKSVNYEINSGKIIFTVVTKAGNYGRIKVTTADNLGGSLGVAVTYTINENGDYVWIVKANAPSDKTTYAFDLRDASTGKYMKKYYMLDVVI